MPTCLPINNIQAFHQTIPIPYILNYNYIFLLIMHFQTNQLFILRKIYIYIHTYYNEYHILLANSGNNNRKNSIVYAIYR